MRNRLETDWTRNIVPATYRGPMPGDFPLGSIQSRAAARGVLNTFKEEQRKVEESELMNLHPSALALLEGVESPGVRSWIIRLCRVAQETEKAYGKALPWPTPEEIRHNREVFKEIDRMTGGEASTVQSGNSVKWNRLKAIAEENLRAKNK